jgi:hypothetical protein
VALLADDFNTDVLRNAATGEPASKRPPGAGCVRTRGSGNAGASYIRFGSGERGPKAAGADEVDGSQDVVGEDAESGFGFHSGEAAGEEASACRHSFDGNGCSAGGLSR